MKKIILILTLISFTFFNASAQCAITANFSNTATGLSTIFNNTSSCNSCVFSSYSWDFGDGNSSVSYNPVHTYAMPGTYNVCLIATGLDTFNNMCMDTICQNVTVSATSGCIATANFTATQFGANYNFTNGTSCVGCNSIVYSWDFGDGNSSILTNPNHSYAFPGLYNVCLTVLAIDSNNNTCIDTFCQNVIVTPSTSCNTSINVFTNGSTITAFANGSQGTSPYTYSYTLNPGNVTNSTGVFSGLANGSYTVCATATDSNNIICSTDCDSALVWVQQPCMANLSATTIGNSASFSTTTTGGTAPFTYYYDFGDGSPIITSMNPNISHFYTNPGTFNACVTAVSAALDSCTSCTNITVAPSPCGLYVGFTQSSNGLTSSFTNTSNCNSCTSITYSWNFGDGNTSALTSPTHTYLMAGTYVVQLFATAIDSNNNTCVDSVDMTITVQPLPPCNIFMTTSTIQLTTTFTPVVTNVLPPLTYFFDYGDGTTGTSNIHTYPTTGTYYPCLTVTDANNITCTFCDTIVVPVPSCNTTLSTSTNGSTITAVATGTWGTAPYTYSYTLTPGNITNITGVFTGLTNGTYTICATATDATNLVCSTICDSAFIWVQQPCYTSLFTTMNGNTLVASASATFGTAPYAYSYNLMPGNITNTSGFFNISSSGTYTVCATATDAQNQVCSTACDTLNIVVTPPQGNCFTSINSTVSGSNVVSVATSTGGVAPYWYQYTLMPGNIINNTGVFTNLAAGIYTICPLSVDSLGDTCVAICDTVQIGGISPCSTTVNVTSIITPIGYTINATATATGGTPGYTYTYTLNPGNITNTTGTFIGLPSGLYVVCATAIDSLNNICSTDCDSINVNNGPPISCNTNISSIVNGSTIISTAVSTGGIAPYMYWYTLMPGNITNNTGVFTNLSPGTYTICPVAVDAIGDTCISYCDTVLVTGSSPCTTTVNATAIATPIGYTINAVATATGGTPPYTYSYTLNPGNITNTTGIFPGLPSGYYAICATATDSLNNICSTDCDSVLAGTISSNCAITAGFSETITSLNVAFTNSSTITNGVITNYGWSFGDGNTSTTMSPNHTYAAPGAYTVILAVSGVDTFQNICADSISKTINVGPNSVNNVVANKLTIYPNPTDNKFTIDIPANERLEKLTITDVSGRTIHTEYQTVGPKKLTVSLDKQASGIYFIKLQTNHQLYTSSIMKQE